MAKQEFLMVCHTLEKKHPVAGRFVSEKLDGQRVFWDAGVTRGMHKANVPWANNDRDGRYKGIQVASGLWSRYGNVIHAPDWFLDELPKIPLDGELYAGRRNFQSLRKIVADLIPDDEAWEAVTLVAFDFPPMATVLADRDINITNFKKQLRGCYDWWLGNGGDTIFDVPPMTTFNDRLFYLNKAWNECPTSAWKVLTQKRLPLQNDQALAELEEFCDNIVCGGGEGVILKSFQSTYETVRSHAQLKMKPSSDAEAKVIGYIWGKLPDNTRTVSGEAGGKLLGKMGALLCQMVNSEGIAYGGVFKLSGFTDAERGMAWTNFSHTAMATGLESVQEYGTRCAGEQANSEIVTNPTFPLGTTVTYRYRELTDDGLPKEPRYFRKPLQEA